MTQTLSKADDTSSDDYIQRALFGDDAAIACYMTLLHVAQCADDVYDNAAAEPPSTHLAMLRDLLIGALCTLPANPFWQRYAGQMSALILQAIYDWEWSELHEAKGGESTAQAHVLRASYIRILSSMAAILGGAAHGAAVQAELMQTRILDYPADHLTSFCKEMQVDGR